MSTARQWRQYDRDRADAELIRRAAAWLRENPERAQHAGLSCDTDAHALAALLDVLAAEIAHLDSAVRWLWGSRSRPGRVTCRDGSQA